MSDLAKKHEERMQRLRNLHTQRVNVGRKTAVVRYKMPRKHLKNEARTANHQEVVEEDKRNKLPKNWEQRKARAQWVIDDETAREVAKGKGEDYDRKRLLDVPADVAEKAERKKMKKNPDQGFSDFEQAAIRKYNTLINNHKVDLEAYNRQKEELGANAFGGANPILLGLTKDSPDAINYMQKDLEKQITKREKYSRRRMHNDEADIDYINERNAKFNKKLERFYGEHTAEIKQNLERGTAV